jgi:HEAT repeat protein
MLRTLCLLTAVAAAAPPSPPPSAADERSRLLDRMITALDDPDAEVRQNLAFAIAASGRDAIPPLMAALEAESPLRRAGAAYALGLLGTSASETAPALLDALRDKDPDVRRQASLALSRVIPPARTPTPPSPSPAAPPTVILPPPVRFPDMDPVPPSPPPPPGKPK